MDTDRLEKMHARFVKLRQELQAIRWALWYAVDAWENGKPWGEGFGGPGAHATEVGISLVGEGRRTEQEREAKGMNDPMSIEKELLFELKAAQPPDEAEK